MPVGLEIGSLVDADVPEADPCRSCRAESRGGQSHLDAAQVMDVTATAAGQAIPYTLGGPQWAVDESAPAARLRQGDADSLTRKLDGSVGQAVAVAEATEDAVEDHPIVLRQLSVRRVPDLEARLLGISGLQRAASRNVDARRRKVDASDARHAHIEQCNAQPAGAATELQHRWTTQRCIAQEVEHAGRDIDQLGHLVSIGPETDLLIEAPRNPRVGWRAAAGRELLVRLSRHSKSIRRVDEGAYPAWRRWP